MVLREKVYQTIKEKILSGEYQCGQPLNEREITQELSVSRTPFREAINALNQENLVQIFDNRGIFVREITAQDISNNFEIRFLLEPFVMQQAALRIPESVIDCLTQEGNAAQQKKYSEMLEVDEHYHRTMLGYMENQFLVDIMENLYDQNRMQRALFDRNNNGIVPEERISAVRKSLQEHQTILDCMRQRDAEGTAEATREHLRRAEDRQRGMPVVTREKVL